VDSKLYDVKVSNLERGVAEAARDATFGPAIRIGFR
jgi:hypothetical protein